MRRRAALGLGVLAWAATTLAACVTVLGPMAVPAIGLSISDASRLWGATAVLLSAALFVARGPGALLDALAGSPAPYVATVVMALAMTLALLAARGAVSVGGADSAGYLAQAHRWTMGTLRVPLPEPGPPSVPASLRVPLGFRLDETATATVPTYPPGLPLIQAAALTLGGEPAAVRVVPILAIVLALVALFGLARGVSGPAGAAVATVTMASLPTVLFQALQPMSDVPALAAWLVALACAPHRGRMVTAVIALSTMAAICIRPNLAPLALLVCWHVVLVGDRGVRRWRLVIVTLAAAVAVACVAAVQWHLYGSPFQSGYGSAADLFSFRHIPPNAWLYPHWFREASSIPATILIAAGTGALLAGAVRDPRLRPLVAVAAVVAASYLVYVPFDSWTYLRFVLLAVAMAAVGLAVLAQAGFGRLSARWRFPAFAALVAIATLPNLRLAQQLDVFGIRAREYRYEAASRVVDALRPTLIVAGQHSAAAAYYTGRPIVRADLLDGTWLANKAILTERRREPMAIVLDVGEAEAFGRRAAGSPLSALDWPPRAEIGRPVTTRVWLASDRDAYRAGTPIHTSRVVAVPR